VETAIVFLGLLLFSVTLWDHFRLRRAVLEQRRAARNVRLVPAKRLPSITVIRPVRGLDVEADKNLAAALDNEYPGEVETIFVFDDDLDPALARRGRR